ncbi:MAG: hypothetical protein HZA17_12045 [Nitrospirae bacterium]|nr:hypothetical protein [Nitrospirota bacterium]
MRKIITMGLIVLGTLSVFADGAIAGGFFCLQQPTSCNDIKVVWSETPDPYIFTISGWEYGCNVTNRLLYGTIKLGNDGLHLNFTKSGFQPSVFSTTYNTTIDYALLTGTYDAVQMVGAEVTSFRGTFNVIDCPASSVMSAKGGARRDEHQQE